MSTTIVLKDACCLDHVMHPGHPERPERLAAIYEMLQGADMFGKFEEIVPRRATKEEISLNHSPAMLMLILAVRLLAVKLLLVVLRPWRPCDPWPFLFNSWRLWVNDL